MTRRSCSGCPRCGGGSSSTCGTTSCTNSRCGGRSGRSSRECCTDFRSSTASARPSYCSYSCTSCASCYGSSGGSSASGRCTPRSGTGASTAQHRACSSSRRVCSGSCCSTTLSRRTRSSRAPPCLGGPTYWLKRLRARRSHWGLYGTRCTGTSCLSRTGRRCRLGSGGWGQACPTNSSSRRS